MKQFKLTILLFVLVSVVGNAQKTSLKRTNKLFSNQAYVEAAASYEMLPRTKEVLTNLGDAYYYIGNLAMAEKTYTELTTLHGKIEDRDRIYKYAQSLLAAKKYKEADDFLGYYHGKYYNTEAFNNTLQKTKPFNYEVSELKNEGSFSDFGMRFYGNNEVIFASSRNKDRPVYSWNGLPYLDLYTAKLENKETLVNVEPVQASINTNLHESNAIITKDGRTMYFNRNSEDRVLIDDKKVSVQRLYKANLENGVWVNEQPLPFSSIDYSTQHPALSNDERTMYFASDMPGGYGKLDLYKVSINNDGTYGTPINLGKTINTEQLDVFPYISNDNTLYYATNGKQGFGGLDLFMAAATKDGFSEAMNLGNDLNSAKDDHSYVVHTSSNTAYFSSDRSGMDRLYSAKPVENEAARFIVQGFVKDKLTGAFLPGAQVVLMDQNGENLQTIVVGDNGNYEFKLAKNSQYFVKATMKGFAASEELFDTNNLDEKSKTILLSLEPYDLIQAKIKENEKGELLVNLEKIYFDYNKALIRKDAAYILEELVNIMTTYPSMNIEVSAHTDARGSESYNLKLSKERASAVVAYLTQRGIKATRLHSIGYGEEKLLNACKTDTDCAEEDHELNRRCEFKILD